MAVLLLASGCSKRPESVISAAGGPVHLAVRPASVLIDAPSSEWLGLGYAIALQAQLSGSRSLAVGFAQSSSDAYLNDSGSILETTLGSRGSNLRVRAQEFGLASGKGQEPTVVEGNLLQCVDRVAHQLDPNGAIPLGTSSVDALHAFTLAAVSGNAQERAALLQQATTADPGFGLAWISLGEVVGPLVLQAGADPNRFTKLDRARWNALTARLRGASNADQMRAQQEVLALAPNNVEALAQSGALQIAAGNKPEGTRLLQQALRLNPANVALEFRLQQLQQH